MSRRLLVWALLLASGCVRGYLERAPATASRAWALPPELLHRRLAVRAAATLDAGHEYALPELIDLAELANPDTRIGWEKARQAALAVGLAKAEYFPTLSLKTIVGYQHLFFPVPHADSAMSSPTTVSTSDSLPNVSFPIPALSKPSGFLGIDTYEVLPFASVKWAALDLRRGAGVRAAEQQSLSANALFTAAHQKIIHDVACAYFRLQAARAQLAVALDALERTRAIDKAAQARFTQGVATVVEKLQAEREVTQGEFEVTQARAAEVDAYATLVSALGIDPAAPMHVAALPSRELPQALDEPVDGYIDAALRARPDLRAALAQLPATQAGVARSNAAYAPRVDLLGTAGDALLGAHIDSVGGKSVNVPNVAVFASLDWLLFDGGAREVQAAIARSRHSEAEQRLLELEHTVVREVIASYNGLQAGLARYRSATALLTTASAAEDAVSKQYGNGLATLTEAMNAEKARAQASASKERAYADALVAATSLALAAGDLTSAGAIPLWR